MFQYERNFTFVFKQSDESLLIMYPRTVAKQVVIGNGYTMEDHVNSTAHLIASERAVLNKINQPMGILKLDNRGFIPMDNLADSVLAIKLEFPTINDLLTNSADVYKGALVMVEDASGDPDVDSGWAIYRRKQNDRYFDLAEGWTRIAERESIDLDMAWSAIPGKPASLVTDIDDMVSKAHTHIQQIVLDGLTADAEGHLYYKNKRIAMKSEVQQFFAGDAVDPSDMKVGDIWLKDSVGQSWWSDNTVEYAGNSCYERYRDQDSILEAPKLRTEDVTTFCRMFYRCYDLETVPQYDTRKGVDFTGMFEECTSLSSVPPMMTYQGETFDDMFKNDSSLLYSPELNLDGAKSTKAMYSGCTNLVRVNEFGSTAHITDMRQMFNGCSALEKILSPIDFSGVTSDAGVENIFNGCIELNQLSVVAGSINVSISFAGTNLSTESILSVLNGLSADCDEKVVNFTGIDALKNINPTMYQAAVDNGWTIIGPTNVPARDVVVAEYSDADTLPASVGGNDVTDVVATGSTVASQKTDIQADTSITLTDVNLTDGAISASIK